MTRSAERACQPASATPMAMTADGRARRCRRPADPAALRPSGVLAVFFAAALAFLACRHGGRESPDPGRDREEVQQRPRDGEPDPSGHPTRDRTIAVAVAVGIGALALAPIEGLERVAAPATLVGVGVALLLAGRIAVLAFAAFTARPRDTLGSERAA